MHPIYDNNGPMAFPQQPMPVINTTPLTFQTSFVAPPPMEQFHRPVEEFDVNREVEFHTPMGDFSAQFDDLHIHKYPEAHNGSQMGANLRITDLATRKSTVVDSYELNTNLDF